MREIYFKAKRLDNGEWVEGYYLKYTKPLNGEIEHRIFVSDSDGVMWYEVHEETICQYTGLTDKNGNKIWENDVVCCCAIDITGRDCEFVSEVFWSDCAWMLHEEEFSDSMLNYFDMSKEWCSHVPEIEVIGSIFDNPELMENE